MPLKVLRQGSVELLLCIRLNGPLLELAVKWDSAWLVAWELWLRNRGRQSCREFGVKRRELTNCTSCSS